MPFDPNMIRKDFPFFSSEQTKDLLYFDNAATTQKPASVIDRLTQYYQSENVNVHRGVYPLAQETTEKFEDVRRKFCRFVRANDPNEIIFTKGTTESVNLVAHAWGDKFINEGDLILVTRQDHHSNWVPWQQLAKRKKARFGIVEIKSDGTLDYESLFGWLKEKPKLFAFSWISNVTGKIMPAKDLAVMAKKAGATVFVDAAQAPLHLSLNVEHFDFLALSGHKMLGPTGSGILWGRTELLEKMDPFLFGGDMIQHVGDQVTTWNELPWKFEAGTPNIADVIALGEAIEYIENLNFDEIKSYESSLATYACAEFKKVSGLRLLGPSEPVDRIPVFSFAVDGLHAQDLMGYLQNIGLCARVGHHCTQPFHEKHGMDSSMRISLAFYNTQEELERFFVAFNEAIAFFENKGLRKKVELKSESLQDCLKPIMDPELKISLVDLGLIYKVDVNDKNEVDVKMTLTSPACPVGPTIMKSVEDKLRAYPGVRGVKVNLVWEPKWDPKEMASEEAKEQLGIW
ncbi:MAG: SufS family cysteine desulfurase [Bdellovibrionota bacterium]